MRDLLYGHQVAGAHDHHRLRVPVRQKPPTQDFRPVGAEIVARARRGVGSGGVRWRAVVSEDALGFGPVRPRSRQIQRAEHTASGEQEPLAAHTGEARSPRGGPPGEVGHHTATTFAPGAFSRRIVLLDPISFRSMNPSCLSATDLGRFRETFRNNLSMRHTLGEWSDRIFGPAARFDGGKTRAVYPFGEYETLDCRTGRRIAGASPPSKFLPRASYTRLRGIA